MRLISTIEELLEDVSLLDIKAVELSARSADLVDHFGSLFSEFYSSHDEGNDAGATDDDHEVHFDRREMLNITRDENGSAFTVRLRIEVNSDLGQVAADYAAFYELKQLTTTAADEDIMLYFANNVSIMALIPYLRNAISSLTLQLFGSALTLPVFKLGELEFQKN